MAAIKLTGFSGEQPRIIPRLMADTAAQAASNARLDDGALTPFRKSARVADAPASDVRTILKYGGSWLTWTADVKAAPGPVADDRLYYMGDGAPKMRVGASIYTLALPAPAPALTATLGGAGAGDVVTRIYSYTWVTSFGEESEPCPASNAIDWQPGNSVTLSGFASAPAGRAITKQRIYRSQTSTSGTGLYLIAERAASAANFSDTIAVDAFQEPLPSMNWNAPPDDLVGLIALPNGMMAAFRDRQLYFCEPYRPHAWPEKYALQTDYPIVGLGAIGASVVVMTTAQPYMVSGTTPETMQMLKIEQNLPCINARGIVDLGYAIAYPSNEGLVVVAADGTCAIATANIFDRDAWQALSPSTLLGGQLGGRYAAFYSTVALDGTKRQGVVFIDLSGKSFLIRGTAYASAVYFDVATSSLFFLDGGGTKIKQFDTPTAANEVLYWKSKQFVLSYPENFGAILIDASTEKSLQDARNLEQAIADTIATNKAVIAAGSIEGELNSHALNTYPFGGDMLLPIPKAESTLTVGVYADGRRIASISKINRPVRLPAGFKARVWEIDVSSDVQIQTIIVGRTMDEVKSLATA